MRQQLQRGWRKSRSCFSFGFSLLLHGGATQLRLADVCYLPCCVLSPMRLGRAGLSTANRMRSWFDNVLNQEGPIRNRTTIEGSQPAPVPTANPTQLTAARESGVRWAIF